MIDIDILRPNKPVQINAKSKSAKPTWNWASLLTPGVKGWEAADQISWRGVADMDRAI
jgi:hypothetical protein